MPYINNRNSAVGLEEAPQIDSEEDLFRRIKLTLDKFLNETEKKHCSYEIKTVGDRRYRVNVLCNKFVNKEDLFPSITRPYSWYVACGDDDEINIF